MSFSALDLLQKLFQTAIAAAQPERILPAYLPDPPPGKTVVIGAGKSAAAMALVVEQHWPKPLTGMVVTRDGHTVPTKHISVLTASHPIPDERGIRAATGLLETVRPLGADDLVLCLLSGGGSALLTLPPMGVTLEAVIDLNRQLLRCGAAITEINTVRKCLSQISGGRLAAAAYPARVISLVISDVPGDDLRAIASGPTVGDTVTAEDALAILQHYDIRVPETVLAYLQTHPDPVVEPNDVRLSKTCHHLIATPQQALMAAATQAQLAGYQPLILGSAIAGEAREVGIVHAGIARQVIQYGQPIAPPCVLLSGGETTVTVKSAGGRGGRNGEFLLSLAIALQGLERVWAIAGDTDGIDGTEDNAGAWITPEILRQAQAQGLDATAFLVRNDSYGFFKALNALIHTGPTLTNVNDFRALVING
jgi:hydroxypyruvate reductase